MKFQLNAQGQSPIFIDELCVICQKEDGELC